MNIETMTGSQRRAVLTDHRNVFCVAGPGSGKTTVLAARSRRLIVGGVPPQRIAAITYTNASARNIEERIDPESSRAGNAIFALGYAGTLHGFCLRMLREHGHAAGYGGRTAVIDEDAANELLAAKVASAGCKDSLKAVIEIKRKGRPTRRPGEVYTKAQLAVLSYIDELTESGLLDFDLILTEFLRIVAKQGPLWQSIKDRFDHVLVDEVQDSAAVDWAIYAALPIANKFLVGDPDQAIFGFRGGRVALCLAHAADPAVEVIQLEENFRCGSEVCRAANALIANNPGRIPKETHPVNGAAFGQVGTLAPCRDENEEVRDVVDAVNDYYTTNDGTTAILARTNAIAAAFREALEASGTDVEQAPQSDLPPDWALCRSLLELLAQPDNDTLAFFYLVARSVAKDFAAPLKARMDAAHIKREANARNQTVNELWFKFPKEVGDVAQVAGTFLDKEGITAEARMLVAELSRELPPGASMLDLALAAAARDRPADPKPSEGVTVTTIHAAKGREWDVVYLVGMEDEATPGTRKGADVEEERRLFFVALTRARREVWISHSATRRAQWGPMPIEPRTPTRFIKEALT